MRASLHINAPRQPLHLRSLWEYRCHLSWPKRQSLNYYSQNCCKATLRAGKVRQACSSWRAKAHVIDRGSQTAALALASNLLNANLIASSSCTAALAVGSPLLLLLLVWPGSAEAMSLSGVADAAVGAVASSGWLGPLVFVLLYVAATVLLFPASVLTLAAGALFGPLAGTALVSLASTLGATCAFLVSRYLARPWVERKVAGLPRFQAVLTGVAAGGPWVVFLLRLSPLVPFNLLNYGLGLTPVGLLPYVAASWAGMLPGTFAYVYLGGAGRAAVDAATGGGSELQMSQLVLYGVGAVATVLATRAISSAASKVLEQKDGS